MENRCFSCMNRIDSNICKHCGADNQELSVVKQQQLRPSTMLRDRFYLGVCIENNGEGNTYIAYDTLEKKRVRVRELFPYSLCHRGDDGCDVISNEGYDIQFKSLKVDFSELSKQLIDLQANNSLLKAKVLFSENHTLYTVYEDVVGMSFTQYLRNNMGELSWEETENLFLPLLYTVKLLNANGITHRGISPDTIIVTNQNELKLTGICTSGVRAINSEIKPELFVGYAAPEQYQKCTGYGEWTDVYSISAVLYKTLTGSMPPRADLRDARTPIISPVQVNPMLPKSVSDAILRGLAFNKENRTLYIKDLIGSLYSSQQTPQAVNIHQSQQENRFTDEPAKKRFRIRIPIWLIVILITLPIMLFLFYYTYSTVIGTPSSPSDNTSSTSSGQSSEPSSEPESSKPSSAPLSSTVNNIAVDNFKDKFYEDVATSKVYETMYKFTKKEVYDEVFPIGVIISQNVVANTVVEPGKEIELTVSKGAQYVVVPPFFDATGLPIELEAYKTFFTDAGLEVTVTQMDGGGIPSGQIFDVSVPVETKIDRETTSSIIIYTAI